MTRTRVFCIEEQPLEWLLENASYLTDKRYSVAQGEFSDKEWLRERLFTAHGKQDGLQVIGKKLVSKHWPPQSAKVSIDAQGLPFFLHQYGTRTVAWYNDSFLGNKSFAEAMGHHYQRCTELARETLAKEQPQILVEFQEYLTSFRKRLPQLRQDIISAYHNGTINEFFSEWPWQEKTIFSLLAIEQGTFDIDIVRNRYPQSGIAQKIRKTPDLRAKIVNEVFRLWYHDRLIAHGYKDKIKASNKEHDSVYAQYLSDIEHSLRERGFEKKEKVLNA